MITKFETYENSPILDTSGSMSMYDLEDKDDNVLVLKSNYFYVLHTFPYYHIYELKTKNGVCTCTEDGDVINMNGTPYSEELKEELAELIKKISMLGEVDKYNL